MVKLLSSLLFCSLFLSAAPQWRNLGPGGGGWIQSIHASRHGEKTLLVGCDVGGFYRSDDAGESYRIHNPGLQDYYVECIVEHPTDPNIVYLGCLSGVYKSTDGGQSWRWLRKGFPEKSRYSWSAPIGALVLDPLNPDVLYAGIGSPRRGKWGSKVLYKSMDAGESWTPLPLPEKVVVSDISIHSQRPRELLVATSAGFLKSEDGGASWSAANTGLPHCQTRRLARCPAQPEIVYATLRSLAGTETWEGGVFRSNDGGTSWQAMNQGLKTWRKEGTKNLMLISNYDRIVVHPQNPDIAYVGGAAWVNSGVYKTIDGGKNWKLAVTKENLQRGWITFWGTTVKCLTLSQRNPDTLYFGTSGMVYQTTDAGNSWKQKYCKQFADGRFAGTGLEVTCLHNLIAHPQMPNRLFFGFYDIGLLRSDDGGKSYRRGIKGITPHEMANSCFDIAFDPADPDHLYGCFGTWGKNIGRLAESTDGGLSWKFLEGANPAPNARCRNLILDGATMFGRFDDKGIYSSTDSGKNWTERNQGLPRQNVRALKRVPGTTSSFYCLLGATRKEVGELFRSDDNCQSWQPLAKGFGDVKKLCATKKHLYLAQREITVDGERISGGVLRSDDGGKTWQLMFADSFAQGLAVDPRNPDVVFAGLTDHPYHDQSTGNGLIASRDGGETWLSLNTDSLAVRQVNVILLDPFNPDRIYVGTGGAATFVTELTPDVWNSLPLCKTSKRN